MASLLKLWCGCLCFVSLPIGAWNGLQSADCAFLGHIHLLFQCPNSVKW